MDSATKGRWRDGRTGCRCRTAYNCGDTHLRRSSEISSEVFSDWHLGSRRRRSRRRLSISSLLPYHQINVIDTQTTGLSTILWTVAVHKLIGRPPHFIVWGGYSPHKIQSLLAQNPQSRLRRHHLSVDHGFQSQRKRE